MVTFAKIIEGPVNITTLGHIYMIDPFIWSNLTKYHHFSKNLVQKSLCLTIYDHFWEYCINKQKKRPCEECTAGHVRVWVEKNHPIIQSNNPIHYPIQYYPILTIQSSSNHPYPIILSNNPIKFIIFNTYPINILLNPINSLLIPLFNPWWMFAAAATGLQGKDK